jgi:hypothetical protein
MLMPKYISGNLDETNTYLESVGIENGLEGVDFTYSSLLQDGRSINVVAVYKLNTKKLTFGLLDMNLCFKQTASTAAWIEPKGDTLTTIADAYKATSETTSETASES